MIEKMKSSRWYLRPFSFKGIIDRKDGFYHLILIVAVLWFGDLADVVAKKDSSFAFKCFGYLMLFVFIWLYAAWLLKRLRDIGLPIFESGFRKTRNVGYMLLPALFLAFFPNFWGMGLFAVSFLICPSGFMKANEENTNAQKS